MTETATKKPVEKIADKLTFEEISLDDVKFRSTQSTAPKKKSRYEEAIDRAKDLPVGRAIVVKTNGADPSKVQTALSLAIRKHARGQFTARRGANEGEVYLVREKKAETETTPPPAA